MEIIYIFAEELKRTAMGKIGSFVKKEYLTLAGLVLGAVGGWLYWRYVGCSGGSCPITSSPLWSSIWGAAMGGLILSMFKRKKNE